MTGTNLTNWRLKLITNRYKLDGTHAIGFKDLVNLGAWIDENFTDVKELTGYQLIADGVHIRINSDLTSIILNFGEPQCDTQTD